MPGAEGSGNLGGATPGPGLLAPVLGKAALEVSIFSRMGCCLDEETSLLTSLSSREDFSLAVFISSRRAA